MLTKPREAAVLEVILVQVVMVDEVYREFIHQLLGQEYPERAGVAEVEEDLMRALT